MKPPSRTPGFRHGSTVLFVAVVAFMGGWLGCGPSEPPWEAVELHQKNLATGQELEHGASATLRYRASGPKFQFECAARRLPRAESYTLIYLPDPWPGTQLIRLANGYSDGGGNLVLKASVDTGSLPAATDASQAVGAHLWLVPSGQITPEGLSDPDTDKCLVERKRIRYTKTETAPE